MRNFQRNTISRCPEHISTSFNIKSYVNERQLENQTSNDGPIFSSLLHITHTQVNNIFSYCWTYVIVEPPPPSTSSPVIPNLSNFQIPLIEGLSSPLWILSLQDLTMCFVVILSWHKNVFPISAWKVLSKYVSFIRRLKHV